MEKLLKSITENILQTKGSDICSPDFFLHSQFNSPLDQFFLNFLLSFLLKTPVSVFSWLFVQLILSLLIPFHIFITLISPFQHNCYLAGYSSVTAKFLAFFLPLFCHDYQFFRTWNIYNSVYSRTVVDFV